VSLTGDGTFSNSGVGASYSWHFNDGTIMNGTSASRNFPNEGVYVVDFVVTDAAGCVNKNCNSRRVIQVSTTPHFNQTVFPDTVCINKPATLLGVVTPVTGVYNCAPPLSDTTFLPDGSGASYSTSIHVSCFTPCDTVRTPADINSICLNMEHSYLGDLDIRIICPNGQQTILKDYNNGGSSAILGDPVATGLPVDSTNLLNPGIGFNYCFSPASTNGFLYSPANWTNVSPYTDPLGNVSVNNPINQVNAGTYQADGSWNNLVGCPLNGNWTIQVTDNLLLDNGYIFSWGIDFGQGLGNYSFTPTYPSQSWNANPDIVATSGATATIVPKSGGIHCYTFSVVDGFNCPYDTTICLYVQDPGNPGRDSFATICSSQTPVNPINYLAGNPTPGGTWSGPGISSTGLFDPLLVTPGDYEVQYKLTKGACDTVSHVKFKVANTYKVDFDFKIGLGCTEDTVHFHNLSDSGIYQWWAYGDGTLPEDTLMNPTHIYLDQGIYQVRLKSKSPLGCIDSAVRIINIIHPLIAKFNTDIDSLCQTDGTPLQFNDASQGAVISWNWNFDDGGTSTLQNPTHPFSLAGNRQVKLVIHDAIPCYDSVVHPIYIDSLPFLTMATDKHAICTGDEINLTAHYLHPAVSLHWDFGDNVHWLENEGATHRYDSPGTYYFTATGHYPVCADVTATDSVVVSAFPKVNLGPDTVLCLDGPAITVSNLAELNDPSVTLLWNTGATTPSINIVHPGKYSLTATRNDCATTENIVVNKDCYTDIPNGFTPNGDGVNDYFYPRQLLSSGVTAFSMAVYDRWGQKIFETTATDGRGWDGKFNGKDQPMGVYIYQIAVVLKNGRAENYNGNVTLVR
jgi:gliding motility-associated-like protein